MKKKVDGIVKECYNTLGNQEEVPLLTLWQGLIRLIQDKKQRLLCFSVCGGVFSAHFLCGHRDAYRKLFLKNLGGA